MFWLKNKYSVFLKIALILLFILTLIAAAYWYFYLPEQRKQNTVKFYLQTYQDLVNDFNTQVWQVQTLKVDNWLAISSLEENLKQNQNLQQALETLNSKLQEEINKKVYTTDNLGFLILEDYKNLRKQTKQMLNFLAYRQCFLQEYLLIQSNQQNINLQYQNLSEQPSRKEVLEIFDLMKNSYLQNAQALSKILSCAEDQEINLDSFQKKQFETAEKWYRQFYIYIQESLLAINLNQPEVYLKTQEDLKTHSQTQPDFLQTETLDKLSSLASYYPEIQQVQVNQAIFENLKLS